MRFWGYSRSYLGPGLRLFGFRLALSLLWVLPVALFLLSLVGAEAPIGAGGTVLLALGAVAALAFVLSAIADVLTTAFVVPIMLSEGSKLLEGWRAFWPTLTGQWVQYLAYLVAAFVIDLALGIVLVLALGLVALCLLIPLGIVVAATALLAEPFLLPVAVVCGLALVAGLVVAWLLLQVPLRTYLRYYALLILGDTNERLDPIPALRARIRGVDDPTTDDRMSRT